MNRNIDGADDKMEPAREEGKARTGLAPTLADKLRAFEARMATKTETDDIRAGGKQIETPAAAPVSAAEDFVPKVFLESDKHALLNEAQEWLNGPKRTNYLALLTGDWGMDSDPESPVNLLKSQRMIHRNLPVFDKDGEELKSAATAVLVNERFLPQAINFFHWFWLAREFPWLAAELSDKERDILEKLQKAFQAIISQHPEIGRLFLQYAFTGLDAVLQFSVHDFLPIDPNTSAARPPELSMQLLDISDGDVKNLAGKKVLDLGCGVSLLAAALREHSVEAYTLDFLSINDLIRSIRKRFTDSDLIKTLGKYLRIFGTDETRKFHRKGSASRIPELFGKVFFDYIFACESITHPRRYKAIRENPDKFRLEILGALRGLSPEKGELRCTAVSTLFTPAMMEKALLPLFIELLERRFEIAGMYDKDGNFSFEKLAQTQRDVMLAGRSPVLQIRRHPVSDCSK